MNIFGMRKGDDARESASGSCACDNMASCDAQGAVCVATDLSASTLAAGVAGAGACVADANSVSIKVLGSGCKRCQALLHNTQEAVSELSLAADIEYVTDMQRVVQYGVMSTPALVVGDSIVSMGNVLKPAEVKELLVRIGVVPDAREA